MVNASFADYSNAPVEKAGLFLYGWAPDAHGKPRLHMLASYTEGRFGRDHKCYSPPKGAVDPGESALQAAIRETMEETGISLRALMGENAYRTFLAGNTVLDAHSNRYEGVSIVKADPQPVAAHEYISGHGARRMCRYFAVEVKGIEHLRSHVKHMHKMDSDALNTAFMPARRLVEEQGMPSFDELLQIMRTGEVTSKRDTAWAGPLPVKIMSHPVLPELEKEWPAPITHIKQWKAFCNGIKGSDFRRLENDVKTLKSYLEAKGMIADNGLHLKLDSRDTPLNFYQEGAEILPVGVMVERSAAMARHNGEYARAMWGEYQGKRRPDRDDATRLASAQIAPLLEFFGTLAPMEIAAASIGRPSSAQKNGKEKPKLCARGLRATEMFADPVVSGSTWQEKVNPTPLAVGEARTAR